MNILRLFLTIVAVSFALPSLRAATDAARELDQLNTERDKALTAAAEPINRRYQTALEALLRRATLANDLETAIRIKQALEKVSAKPPAAPTGTKAELVGAWNFANHNDGVTGVCEFKSDNSFFFADRKRGEWEIKSKQVIITWDGGGVQDRYNLPVHDSKLEGTNNSGHKLTLTRKTD
jgi:hypothetical protein